jgi:hypothetical protein
MLKKNEWLTNGHIDAYQELIHNKFKQSGFCGFFHPIRYETMKNDFYFNPETIHETPFIQVLNADNKHWVTLTNYHILKTK